MAIPMGAAESYSAEGKTVSIVREDRKLVCLISVADSVKADRCVSVPARIMQATDNGARWSIGAVPRG